MRVGYAVFQVTAANVIASLSLEAAIVCGQSPGAVRMLVFISEDNVFSDELPDGMYKATRGSAENNKECSATWRLVSPTDILDVSLC